jgi:hypothetical protein
MGNITEITNPITSNGFKSIISDSIDTGDSNSAFGEFPQGIDVQSFIANIDTGGSSSTSGLMAQLQPIINEFMAKLKPLLNEFMAKIQPIINAFTSNFKSSSPEANFPETSGGGSSGESEEPTDSPDMDTSPQGTASGGAAAQAGTAGTPPSSSTGGSDPGTTEGRAKYIMERLQKELGLTKEQAAGIVGNLMLESGLDPNARNPGDGADGSDSIGIAQWNMDRAKGVQPGDFVGQVDHLIAELKGPENASLEAIKRAGSATEAATIFSDEYERPSNGHESLQYRIDNANWAAGI